MIKISNIFSNGMVLAKKACIWGFTDEKNVEIKFLGNIYNVKPNEKGNFSLEIETPNYGGPYSLVIGDKVIHDVYVGYVWLCAGQSNMEQPLMRSMYLEDYIKPDVRIHAFQVEKGFKFGDEAQDVNASWKTATGYFLQELFSVPYFFARKLLEENSDNEKITHIGLLNVAAGGTPIEAWMPEDIIKTFPDLEKKLEPFKNEIYVKELEKQGNRQHQDWFSNLNFDSDTPFKKTDLLSPVMDTPGVVIYKKIVPYVEGSIKLSLGRAVDSVRVFVNGKSIGQVSYQYPPAVFDIPEGIFEKNIENIIEMHLIGETQPPHFIPGKKYELSHKSGSLDISCDWLYKITCTKEKIVPSFWFYNIPTCCYNYMLAPILGYGIDGVIWYQGESNTGEPNNYKQMFELFVKHLREKYGEVPVIYTQLANFINPGEDMGTGWPILREEQRKCLDIENTSMAVTIDCGEYNDLHPTDKKTVGERLALLAIDKNNMGPLPKEATLSKGVLTITLDNAEGLWAKNGRPVLELDENYTLKAKIVKNTLVAKTDKPKNEVKYVRFGWDDCPSVTLYNAKGLPASPFEIKLK